MIYSRILNLHTYIDNAEYVGTDGIVKFEEKWDEIYNELFGDDTNFYSTGWSSLDEIIKIKTGYLMVVSGYPSRGKSTFVDNLLVNLTSSISSTVRSVMFIRFFIILLHSLRDSF
mgnify:CR=1 FL=1